MSTMPKSRRVSLQQQAARLATQRLVLLHPDQFRALYSEAMREVTSVAGQMRARAQRRPTETVVVHQVPTEVTSTVSLTRVTISA